jgi:hypothetical protein
MAILINQIPNPIDDYADFNIDTNLIEDTDHVNLRIRADIYNEGIIKASIDKPKGLINFNFADILKSLTPGLKFARDSGLSYQAGSVGANLIDMVYGGYGVDHGTITASGNIVSSAIDSSPQSCALGSSTGYSYSIPLKANTNYVFYLQNYINNIYPSGNLVALIVDSGGVDCNTLIKHSNILPIVNNKQIIISTFAAGGCFIEIQCYGASNWSGEFYLKEITTDKETIGSPLCPYFVIFTEVFETALGVTTLSNSWATNMLRYVPASVSGYIPSTTYSNFYENYSLKGGDSLFANVTLKNNITKFFTSNPYEYWVVFFTEAVSLELNTSKDGGANDNSVHPFVYEGWCVIILNIGELMSSVASTLAFYLKEVGTGYTFSETFTIHVDNIQNDARVVLEFDGSAGGKEYLAFEGMKDIKYSTIRNYFTGSKKGKKPLLFTGINKQSIATRMGSGVNDMVNTSYLKTLMISMDVKRLELSYADPTEVTIVSDPIQISSSDMFTNQIDLEYEDE